MAEVYIQNALETYLTTDSDITSSAISTRSYYEETPTDPTYPYLVFMLVPNSDTQESQALSKLNTSQPRVQIDIWATNAVAIDAYRTVKSKLRRFAGTMGGITVDRSDITSAREYQDEETRIYRFGFDWLPVYEEVQ